MSASHDAGASVPIALEGVRRRLDGSTGRTYWKSLEELAESPGFREFLHREFPEQASVFDDPKGRREFLSLMGASLALAGLTGCTRQPTEKIVPYVTQPEDVVLGRPLFFATVACPDGYARGVLVESHEGRPTKVEGNPDHPQSLGATDAFGQAHVLGLYDPDRSTTVKFQGEVRPLAAFKEALTAVLAKQKATGGRGLRFLSGTLTSPTLAAQVDRLMAAYPEARWHGYEPAGRENERAGALLAFGEAVVPQYHLALADVILCLEADFVSRGPSSLRLIREFARRRRPAAAAGMNRLYAVESTPTATGANADHRLGLRSASIEGVARAVAAGLGLPVTGGTSEHADWVGPLVKDLLAHAGSAVVMAGETQPPAVHALAHVINEKLGAFGKTVTFTALPEVRADDPATSLRELTEAMAAGGVEALIVLDGGTNPVYSAPADVPFAEALDQVPFRAHLGLYEDETSERCHWHLPETHPLEAWSDARSADGTASIVQPLIAPLHGGVSAHDLMAACGVASEKGGYDHVREHWKGALGEADFEKRWREALHEGLVPNTAFPARDVAVKPGEWMRASPTPPTPGFEILFRADPSVVDGRFANSGWLQELPKPLTKLTWENTAIVSPALAKTLGVKIRQHADGHATDVVELKYKGRTLEAPVWVLPGQPADSVTVHLGYGRTRAGRVGTGVGFDAYALRTSDAPWSGPGLEVRMTGKKAIVACTQDHWTIEPEPHLAASDRHLVRSASAADYSKDPQVFQAMGHDPKPELSLYPPHKYEGHAWGMSIDLGACVGCNACITACQSENNVPVVGKDQVARGREMHWIRVDRYYTGSPDAPQTYHQPVVCMHCENAPCEVVCPVTATVHSDEGLNDMVYNRCVGTRYCSNNCPYKVRRFNFFLYQDWTTPTFKMMRNPDVSIRSRGVMEKCTYCVQRINRARIDAKNEGRGIRDGEIRTACEAACPAEAIVFGDVNDAKSQVSLRKAEPRSYGLLTELQTRPRTTYLAAVRNPNPAMPGSGEAHHG